MAARAERLAQLAPVFRAELARRHLADFCALMDPRYEPAAHTDLLCEHLEAVERGELRRLMVFLPPRHSKTYHVAERFPAWCIGRDPTRQVILTSYGAELAEQASRKARGLLLHPAWPFAGCLADESTAVNRWHTAQGGVVIAAGVGGAITGFGAHLLVIDDPVKGREEADSESYRERVWQWYLEVARTRLMPGGRMVLCQTRWHEDDLAGRILSGPRAAEWTVLALPALAEVGDPLGRAEGEPLWRAWFDREELEAMRAELGSRAWAALYRQQPTVDEDGMFKRAWFARRYTAPPNLRGKVMAVDSAFKTGVLNDYSVIATWGTDGVDFYLLNVWRGRVEFPELEHAIVRQHELNRPHSVLIEDTAAGQAAAQTLRRYTSLPIIPVKVTATKEARAAAISPLCEAGKVVLPANAPWVDDWIDEHAAFPTGRFDDQVDTTSIALERLPRYRLTASERQHGIVFVTGQLPRRGAGDLIAEYRRQNWPRV
jgi:predicted phage terminase large subunit-like protein